MSTLRKERTMRKAEKPGRPEQGRVLARILAEDLRNVQVSGAGGTVEITYDGGKVRDMTNYGSDGDAV
jgi:hypothetical protein